MSEKRLLRRISRQPIKRHFSAVLAALMIAGSGLAVTTTTAYATDGILDTTFGTGGKVTSSVTGSSVDVGNAMAIASDGSIFVAGSTGTSLDFVIAKYTSSGQLDTSFGTTGFSVVDIGSAYDSASSITVLPSNSILIGGTTGSGSSENFALIKLLSNGTLDTSFGTSGKVTTNFTGNNRDSSQGMAISRNGEIYLSGLVSTAGAIDFGVAKYTALGALDQTFSGDGLLTIDVPNSNGVSDTDDAHAIALHPDGSIILGGYYDGTPVVSTLVKISASGVLDSTFDQDGKVSTDFFSGYSEQINAIAVSLSGDIYVAGDGYNPDGSNTNFFVGKYTSTGALDLTFSSDGKAYADFFGGTDVATSVAVLADGTVLAGGTITATDTRNDFGLVKFTAAGLVDTSFGTNGKVTTSFSIGHDVATAMGITLSGSIILGGYSGYSAGISGDFAVVKYSGSTPVTSTTSTSTSSTTSTTLVQNSNVTAATTTTSSTSVIPTSTVVSAEVAKAPVLRVKKYDYTATSLARLVNMKILKTSKASMTVMKSSKKFCAVAKNRLRGLRVGTCRVTVRVKAKNGKIASKRLSLPVVK